MATTVSLKKMLHRKEWQQMTPCPTSNGAAMFTVTDARGTDPRAMYIASASVHYIYNANEDAWVALTASGIAGTFAAGSCGAFHPSGPTGTATAGSTTTITTNLTIPQDLNGYTVRITAGTNAGQESVITNNTHGANSVLTVSPAFTGAIDATSQYVLMTGRYWFFNAGTVAVGFKYYDWALATWSAALSVTGLPTAWGTDARLITTPGFYTGATGFSTHTATAGASTTLTDSGRAWATNQWANYQVRIISGTGAGQVRTISSNTGTVLTVSVSWTVNPDATSVYVIEGNDDNIYLMGNNAVTLYKYSISGNTWATLTPGVARSAAMGGGGGGNWVAFSTDTRWTDETAIKNGRYLYSFRGAASTALDIYDIAANSWSQTTTYGQLGDTFTSGSAYDIDGNYIYISKEATGRIFRYEINRDRIEPVTTLIYPNSTATVGDKFWTMSFIDGATVIDYLYYIRHTGSELFRCLII